MNSMFLAPFAVFFEFNLALNAAYIFMRVIVEAFTITASQSNKVGLRHLDSL